MGGLVRVRLRRPVPRSDRAGAAGRAVPVSRTKRAAASSASLTARRAERRSRLVDTRSASPRVAASSRCGRPSTSPAAARRASRAAGRTRADDDAGRPHPRPCAGRRRRQGPLRQGTRARAAGRPRRHRRAFDEGRAERAAAGARDRGGAAAREPAATRSSRCAIGASPSCPTARASARRARAGKRSCAHARPDLAAASCCAATSTRACASSTDGSLDAIVLACAGLERLGLADRITEVLTAELSLPAVGQGVIGIEARTDDVRSRAVSSPRWITPTRTRDCAPSALSRDARRQLPLADCGACRDRRRPSSAGRLRRCAGRQRDLPRQSWAGRRRTPRRSAVTLAQRLSVGGRGRTARAPATAAVDTLR